MGLNKMLKAGLAEEKEQLAKASAKPKSFAEKKEITSKVVELPAEDDLPKVKKKTITQKHAGGRPTNESKGKTSRKQYTLTLIPNDYSKIMNLADADGLSFSKYIERAVNEYISNHQDE